MMIELLNEELERTMSFVGIPRRSRTSHPAPLRPYLPAARSQETQQGPPMTSARPVEELDRRYVFHAVRRSSTSTSSTGPPSSDRRGHGARLRRPPRQSYIDGMAGLWCVNIGYGGQRSATR
jgi:hypothetical protein